MKNFGKRDLFENLHQITTTGDNKTEEVVQIMVKAGLILAHGPDRPVIISQEQAETSETIFENLKGEFRSGNVEK